MFLPSQRHELPDHFLAFANPTRLRILQRLGEVGEESVNDLAVHLHMENLRRARFRSGTIPVSDVLLRALPGIRARIINALHRHGIYW